MYEKNIILVFPNYSQGGAEKAFNSYKEVLADSFNVEIVKNNAPNQGIARKFYVYLNYLSALTKCFMVLYRLNGARASVIIFKGHVICVPFLVILNATKRRKFSILMRESNDVKGYAHSEIINKLSRLVFKYLFKKIPANLADVVICNSQQSKRNFIEFTQISPDKVSAIYNPQISLGLQKEKVLKKKRYGVAFVGRFEGQKNPLRFLRIIEMLPENINAVMVGSGSLYADIIKFIGERNLAKRVSVMEYSKSNAKNALDSSSLLLVTSKYEGMPNVIFEALECGSAVVSLDISSGPSEILPQRFIAVSNQDEELVLLVDDFLKDNIEEISPEEWQEMLTKFSKQTFLTEFNNLIKVL